MLIRVLLTTRDASLGKKLGYWTRQIIVRKTNDKMLVTLHYRLGSYHQRRSITRRQVWL